MASCALLCSFTSRTDETQRGVETSLRYEHNISTHIKLHFARTRLLNHLLPNSLRSQWIPLPQRRKGSHESLQLYQLGVQCVQRHKRPTPNSRSRDAETGRLVPTRTKQKIITQEVRLCPTPGRINKNPRAHNTMPAIPVGPHSENPGTPDLPYTNTLKAITPQQSSILPDPTGTPVIPLGPTNRSRLRKNETALYYY